MTPSDRSSRARTPLGRTAAELAQDVRSGAATAREVVAAHLDRIAALDERVGAFMVVRAGDALAEADAIDAHPDRSRLPLAGVPVAVKDNIPFAGLPTRDGSPLTPTDPATEDHVVVRRLREAGAVVVGTTRVPELCVWPFTDGPLGTSRNPWNLQRTPGGSSGGSAAAVSAGFVPLAHGNDGLGSIRIPAACCGLVGLKPGFGTVPAQIGHDAWTGMAENGPLATTVADAALGLAVMAGEPALADVAPAAALGRPLRIGLSVQALIPGTRIDPAWKAAAFGAAKALRQAGHEVSRAVLPAPLWAVRAGLARWFAGTENDAALAGTSRALPTRTATHARLGRFALARGWVREDDRTRMREVLAPLLDRFDVVLQPGLAGSPPAADGHAERGWWHNYWLASSFSGALQGPLNVAGYPSMTVPAGRHADGMPLAVQLSTGPAVAGALSGEALLLSVAAVLETVQPWQRLAPLG